MGQESTSMLERIRQLESCNLSHIISGPDIDAIVLVRTNQHHHTQLIRLSAPATGVGGYDIYVLPLTSRYTDVAMFLNDCLYVCLCLCLIACL